MRLTYDPQYNIAYIRFRRKRAQVTTIEVSDELNVDIDQQGRVYGIELLNANEQLAGERIKKLIVENQQSGTSDEIRLAV